jgi:hypothetical protein
MKARLAFQWNAPKSTKRNLKRKPPQNNSTKQPLAAQLRGAGILILRQNPLSNKRLWLGAVLNLMLQVIGQHMALELTGLSLQGRRGGGSGEDITLAS